MPDERCTGALPVGIALCRVELGAGLGAQAGAEGRSGSAEVAAGSRDGSSAAAGDVDGDSVAPGALQPSHAGIVVTRTGSGGSGARGAVAKGRRRVGEREVRVLDVGHWRRCASRRGRCRRRAGADGTARWSGSVLWTRRCAGPAQGDEVPGLWNHSPRGTAGRAVVGVEGASLAVLTANVLEGCAQRRRTRECVGRALLVSGDEKERRGGGCERRDRGHCWWLGDGGSGGARIGEGGAGHGEGEET